MPPTRGAGDTSATAVPEASTPASEPGFRGNVVFVLGISVGVAAAASSGGGGGEEGFERDHVQGKVKRVDVGSCFYFSPLNYKKVEWGNGREVLPRGWVGGRTRGRDLRRARTRAGVEWFGARASCVSRCVALGGGTVDERLTTQPPIANTTRGSVSECYQIKRPQPLTGNVQNYDRTPRPAATGTACLQLVREVFFW